jgi:HAD superfamily hydrolase (TIGR01509 family)
MNIRTFKAALFDLDGVVFDTEPQYSVFWGEQMRHYFPERPGLENVIKGQTLVQIYDKFFPGMKEEQERITAGLDEFEGQMKFEYIAGFPSFIEDLRRNGVRTAVVTSSNKPKMENVYRSHHEFKDLFDLVLTSEDFTKSKPDPECYLIGAAKFGLSPNECFGFEDSFNGLKSVKASGMTVVGLATTNSPEAIREFSDVILSDYVGLDYQRLLSLI